MDAQQPPFLIPGLESLDQLAHDLVSACTSGEADARRRVAKHFELGRTPAREGFREYTHEKLRRLRPSAEPVADLSLDDARLIVSDAYHFPSWQELSKHNEAMNQPGSLVWQFESAADAVIAGVQIDLLDALLQAGASVDGAPGGWNPLIAALHNGRGEAAAFLAARGAVLDLEAAAGAGRLDAVKGFFQDDGSLKSNATREQMELGFKWACAYGHTRVVDFLLQRGVNVAALHGETGLHSAAYGAHRDVVKQLLTHNAPVHAHDERYDTTPLGWAIHGWGEPPPGTEPESYYEVVALLVGAGSAIQPEWLLEENVRLDSRMLALLKGAV